MGDFLTVPLTGQLYSVPGLPSYVGSSAGGGGGTVTSVFGRPGPAIVAQVGDYDSSQVLNTSLAPGPTVEVALTNVRDILPSPDVATIGNVALNGPDANIDTGVTLVSGTTVIFVWLQTDPKQNGLYLYNSGGAWSRAPNWTTSAAFRPAQPFQIAGGNKYGGRTAYLKNSAQPTLGTSNIIFNVDMQVNNPTADNQAAFYRLATNDVAWSGPKSAQLSDADATLAIGTAYTYVMQVQPTVLRNWTLDNTGAAAVGPACIVVDIRVALAFPIQMKNALGNLYQFLAGSGWLASFVFGGGQWAGPVAIQAQ